MNEDYLWDRSGPPDPDVVALERLLSPLGQRQPPAPLRFGVLAAAPRVILTLAAAAIVVLAVSTLRLGLRTQQSGWEVVEVQGAATIGSRVVGEHTRFPVGGSLQTDRKGRAVIELGDVGRVEIGPATRVRLLATRTGHHRLALDRGTLTASIWAQPGQFFVETPSALAVDLGCAYTIQVDPRGVGVLRVTFGWVGFEWHDRRVLIPAGAVAETRPGIGPGTPHYEDAPAALSAALDVLDFGDADAAARSVALDRVLAVARPRDAFTLWHLLQRVDVEGRSRVYDRLAALVPPPPDVTREGVRSGDTRMLDLWWDRLGLDSADWWRAWSRPWTEPR